MMVRMPKELRDQIKSAAEVSGRSQNSEIVARLDTTGVISLRDWFAGQALAGVMDLCRSDTLLPGQTRSQLFAATAYRLADAMLAARAEGGAQ
ncbi:Arc family DNA-binding protein [Pseudogemmobacter sonorensis]|uniref:Arc family DNA-binding protein n=1 Tax=Pseudogemmobacter sonorensis TaxID=2989681 RepID=UPI0036BB1AA6